MDSDSGQAGREPSKLDVQAELIVSAYRAKGIDVGVARLPDGSLDFLYQRGAILVRSSYLDRVDEIVGAGEGGDEEGQREATGRGDRSGHDHSVEGVTLYSLAGARIGDTLEALRAIDRELGPGIATPNHVFSITPVYPCPATEPARVPPDMPPDPGMCDGSGTGVFIYVPDTGLLKDAALHPWLAGVAGRPEELPPPDINGVVMIPEYTGHGTFVAGVARCMAPVSTVFVTDDFTTAGVLSEFEIVQRLNHALGLGVDIISLSAGGTHTAQPSAARIRGILEPIPLTQGRAAGCGSREQFHPQAVLAGRVLASGRGRGAGGEQARTSPFQ